MGTSGREWGPAALLLVIFGVAMATAGASAGGEVAAVPALVPHATAADSSPEAVDLTAPEARGAGQEDESKQLEGMLHWCAASACSCQCYGLLLICCAAIGDDQIMSRGDGMKSQQQDRARCATAQGDSELGS